MDMGKLSAAMVFFLTAVSLCSAAGRKYVTYEEYGAVGDGIHDDQEAIIAAHKAANELGLPVKATDGKTYRIGRGSGVAVIRTDVDFGKARFVIDDTVTDNYSAPVFTVKSDMEPIAIQGINSLRKKQGNLGVRLPERSLVLVENAHKKVYIRYGPNQNSGTPQKEVLIAGKNGRIDNGSPITWDYDEVTRAVAYPIDRKTLTIKGGIFVTIANQAPSTYAYRGRGFAINRSNVRVENITHYVEGELDHGAPYSGFLSFGYCADVVVTGCLLTPHKTYRTIGSAGIPVSMGSYDLQASYCVNVLFEHGRQTRDIDDRAYWGLFASNFCKNLRMDDMVISRFDAHMGVANLTLTNCTFGHMGVQAIGFGRMLVKNCEIHRNTLVWLRDDYGSTWNGDIIIKGCTLKPGGGDSATIISGLNSGKHDFGYVCHLPRRVIVKNLTIDDSRIDAPSYQGPSVFGSFGRDAAAPDLEPYEPTEEVILDNVKVLSGKELTLSPNPILFKDTKVRGLQIGAK